jgi:CBS domain-containing protein
MSSDLVVLTPDMEVLRAMELLMTREISGAPVVDPHGNLVGILTERDCLRVAFDASYHQHPGGKVAEYMSRDVETIPASLDLIAVIERFLRSRYRRFPVLEGTRLVGQISRRDILRAILELW